RDPQAEPPSPLIGDESIDEGADDVADQAAGDRIRDRRRGHVELGRDHRCRERDRHDVEEGKEVARPDDPQQLALVRPNWNPVEARQRTSPTTSDARASLFGSDGRTWFTCRHLTSLVCPMTYPAGGVGNA